MTDWAQYPSTAWPEVLGTSHLELLAPLEPRFTIAARLHKKMVAHVLSFLCHAESYALYLHPAGVLTCLVIAKLHPYSVFVKDYFYPSIIPTGPELLRWEKCELLEITHCEMEQVGESQFDRSEETEACH